MKTSLICACTAVFAVALFTPMAEATTKAASKLPSILKAEHRSDENKLRDKYRNPAEVIEFFGVEPDDKVIEFWPGSGWYSEILAPYVKEAGEFFAATFNENNLNSSDKRDVYWSKVAKKYKDKMSDAGLYGDVRFSTFDNSELSGDVPENEIDVALIIRSIHIWDEEGDLASGLNEVFRVLKSGGTLGIVQHRANAISDLSSIAVDGYMDERYVISAAEKAGFKLVASSEINSNLKDTKDYPKGVYTLPPTLAMGSTDRDKYLKIGESDRMTLKFVKP